MIILGDTKISLTYCAVHRHSPTAERRYGGEGRRISHTALLYLQLQLLARKTMCKSILFLSRLQDILNIDSILNFKHISIVSDVRRHMYLARGYVRGTARHPHGWNCATTQPFNRTVKKKQISHQCDIVRPPCATRYRYCQNR